MSAFWRRKVDLPAMLGPVTNHNRPTSFAATGCNHWARRTRLCAVAAPLPPPDGGRGGCSKVSPTIDLGPGVTLRHRQFAQRRAPTSSTDSASAVAAIGSA